MKRFPTLQADIAAAANDALERFREDSRKTVLRLVEMESSYLTVDFFRKLPLEAEKGGNPTAPTTDRYADAHLRRIGMFIPWHIQRAAIDQAGLFCRFYLIIYVSSLLFCLCRGVGGFALSLDTQAGFALDLQSF